MTKKHFAILAFGLTVGFFFLFLRFLPIEVAGHRPGMSPTLLINAGFMAVTTVFVLIFALILLVRRDYMYSQISTLMRFRHLLKLMVKRDFITRYRRSILGVLWSLLNPLLTMLIINMVFSEVFRFDIAYFPVYFLSGNLIFAYFSESTTLAMGSITNSAGIIKKLYVPKYIFPLARALSALVNLGFSLLAFFFILIVTGHPIHWTLILLPIPLLYTFIFVLGLGMLLSALLVFFRDIGHIYTIMLTLIMFLTPIFYPVDMLPQHVYHLIHFNPIFHFVTYFRSLAMDGVIPGLWPNIICLGFALCALCVGLYVKSSQQDKYILYL